MTIDVICSECGRHQSLDYLSEGLYRYLDGLRIEYAMPDLSEDEMNLIENGVCEECANGR